MLSAILRKPVARVVDPVAVLLLRIGVTPNGMTFFGSLGTCGIALWLWPQGEYFWGTMGVIAFIFSDLLDGTMARISKKSTQWGAFFDSTIDRVVDVALIGALLLSLLKTDDRLAVVAFTALIGGFLVSYVKARAQALSFNCDGGFAERAERVIILLTAVGFAGLGVPYILAIGVWILAITSLATFVFRVHQVWKQR
ncbi:MAG: CDP-alcohol phosphatidyltransferase family protein [Actinomycetes bacterium]|nr:CDP-alcohol phosphatidyltransferase family protein [Actinomycetota bacterium]